MSISGKVVSLIQDNDVVVIAAAFFTLLGATIFTQKFLSFLKLLLDVFVIPGTSLKKFGAGNGAWAVVTGSSDGIGKEFAQQLAAAKFNILLISRTQSKLEAIAADLEQKYAIETKIYAMDFTKGDSKDFENLRNIISQIDVGILVNNVAMSHEIPTPFVEESEEAIQNMVETNISGLLKITKIAIPVMTEKKRGLIINVGSFNGYIPAPYLSVYSGSKAFMSAWSAAIGMELKSKGILVQHVNTYFVATAMSKIRKATWLIPFPKPYVKSVLAKIGVPGGAADVPFSTNTYTPHAIGNWFIANTFGLNYWMRQSFAIHTDIRRRALRKREREAAASKNQ